MQSYRSLRDGKEFNNPILLEIAEKSGKSVAQILGRWCIQRNVVYIPKSVKEERIIENFNVFDFELSESDIEIMDGLTTEKAKEKFIEGYRVGVVRGTDVGVEEVRDVTLD